MFKELEKINSRPAPFQFYTADALWTDEYTSKKMLEYHLNESLDLSSRNKDFIDKSVSWIISHFGVGANKKIADFVCGPGLYTTRFAESDAVVTGIDFSERSICYAKEIADKYYGFLNTFKYNEEKITLDKYTIIEETRTRVIYNWLQYFNQDSLRKEFEER